LALGHHNPQTEAGTLRPSRQVAMLLAENLGVPPDERDAFVEFARRGAAADAPVDPQAPWRAAAAPRLPAALTALVGRTRELEAACALVRRPDVRLLTLCGPPGIGKTRLGLQIARDVQAGFPGGVYFVPLEPVTRAGDVPEALAHALGVVETQRRGLLDGGDRSRRAVAARAGHFEQVIDAGR
jgi:hypothetical protein